MPCFSLPLIATVPWRRLLIAFSAGLLITGAWSRCHAQVTPEGQAELLTRRDELDGQASEAIAQGDWAAAVKAGRDAVEIERKALGDGHDQVFESMQELTFWVLDEEGIAAAKEIATDWRKLAETAHGPDDWRAADARRMLTFVEKIGALPADQVAQLRSLDKRGVTLFYQEEYEQSISVLQRLVDRLTPVTGEQHFVIADCLGLISYGFTELENREQDELFTRRALKIREAVLGLNHPDTALSLSDVAWLHQQRGESKQAATRYQQVLEILKPLVGTENQQYSSALDRLAAIYVEGYHDDQAETVLAEAVALYRSEGDDESVAAANRTLGKVLNKQQKYREAIPHFQAAAEAFDRLENPEQAAWMFDWIGACYRELSEANAAADAYAIAVTRFEKLGHDEGLALNTHYLALQLVRLGKHQEALEKHQAALEAAGRAFPPESPKIIDFMKKMADGLAGSGKIAEAREEFARAMAILDRRHPGDHSEKLGVQQSIATSLALEGKFAEATRINNEMLAMAKRLHTGNHDEVVSALYHVAKSQYLAAEHEESRKNLQQALAMNGRLHPGDHAVTAAISESLGSTLEFLGRRTEALEQFQLSLDMMRRLHGDKDPTIPNTLDNIARTLNSLGRNSEAQAARQEATTLRQKLQGGDSLTVAFQLMALAGRIEAQGKHQLAAENYERGFGIIKRLDYEENLFTAIARTGYAASLKSLGRLDEAIAQSHRSITVVKKVIGGDSVYLGAAHHQYGLALSAAGRYKDADDAYRTGLAIRQRVGDVSAYTTAANLGWMLLRHENKPAEAADMFELSIEGAEVARMLVGGEDLDRSQFFAYTEDEYDMFFGMVCAQLALDRPDQSLVYLERGRARALLDLLERGRRLAGEDILQPVQRRAELTKNDRLLKDIATARERLSTAGDEVARLNAVIQQARSNQKADEAARGAKIEGLYQQLVRAQETHRRSLRAVFNLAGEHTSTDLKPLRTEEIQGLLSGNQRLLVYAIGTYESYVFVVPPPGQQVRAINLRWPIGEVPTAKRMPSEGVLVQNVLKDSAAEAAGLAVSDVILAYAGKAVTPENFLETVSASTSAEDVISLRVWRDGIERTVRVPSGRLGVFFAMSSPASMQKTSEANSKVTSKTLSILVSQYIGMMQQEGQRRGLQSTESPSPKGDVARLGSNLFKALIPDDLWTELKATDLVYIVPDGALNRLPFESLVVEPPAVNLESQLLAANRTYWLDEGPAIGYGSSATVLVNRRLARDQQLLQQSQGSRPSSLAVALGNPIFQRSTDAVPVAPEQGCLVLTVQVGSVAALADVVRGDVIMEYDQKKVADDRQLRDLLRAIADAIEEGEREAAPIPLKLWRRGKQLTVMVRAGPLGIEMARQAPREAWVALQSGEIGKLATVTRGGYLTRYGQLTTLPGTETEILSIRKSLARESTGDAAGRVVTLLQEDATRTQLFANVGGTRFLHLATHGLVDETDKVCWSSLALTQPAVPTADDFGFLTLNDLFQNWWGKLSATELVVLSACDSQRGRLSGNEGVFGMPWGFMYAGSPAVIASLWPVDDASTAQLMGNLYGEIHQINAATALASDAAKLRAFVAVRQALRKQYAEPYFWAPFVYLGDPR